MAKELVNNNGDVFFEAAGTIKSYNVTTGYGFIFTIESPDTDIFFHVSQFITKDKADIQIGTDVEFLYKNVEGKGFRAYKIRKMQKE